MLSMLLRGGGKQINGRFVVGLGRRILVNSWHDKALEFLGIFL